MAIHGWRRNGRPGLWPATVSTPSRQNRLTRRWMVPELKTQGHHILPGKPRQVARFAFFSSTWISLSNFER